MNMNEKIEQKLTKDNIKPTSMRVLVLKELLESSTAVGIKELEKRFEEWKGDTRQIDDVIVLGIKI